MKPALQRGLWLWAGLLAVMLCLLFLPLPPAARGAGVGVVIVIVIIGLIRVGRQPVDAGSLRFSGLPEASYRLPIVLVCGEKADWPGNSATYQTSQGCWLRVDEGVELRHIVRELLCLRPSWAGQLAVMICVNPQQYEHTTALAPRLYELRWQINRLRRETRQTVPLLLSSRIAGQTVTEPVWQAVLPGGLVRVWQEDYAPCSVPVWTAQDESGARLQQQVMLNSLASWFSQHVSSVFTAESPDIPTILPCAVLFHQGRSMADTAKHTCWAHWLQQQTGLVQVAGWMPADEHSALPLPDFVLPLLPKGYALTAPQRAGSHAFILLTLAAIAALCSSGWHNRQLLQRTAFDIRHYYAIAMQDDEPKARAVAVLRAHASQLDNWARNGEPLRLGLGLYQGGRLRLPLLNAIRSYVPPLPSSIPAPKPAPNIIRLNSLSLFDVGSAQLKPGSTKVLVNALVGIKAKPGWLIVVAGHTDDTGDVASNQLLSLKRAESVRNWMRDTGAIPESCFAVQGYGESRPHDTNDTEAGRAANRRVEISLVPQADACQVTGATTVSPALGDALTQKMEK
ncbi:OmpA family protein [Chimaeribacter arupi]|uniref:OmpA family protein n=1 Tax=Chimaeribacter arupi TaxID=2060066 RepID=UPI0029448797|nr:OmpA family protein [Chimaeribacter arupi]MDV5140543.1 OmpA family protein [Chimaeribacter arupi]